MSLSARERFEALFDRYHGDIAAYVRRRAPAAVVEDAVAETFLVAWRSLDRLQGDPLPWLYGVAWRVLANERRSRRRRRALGERLAIERDGAEPPALLAAEVSDRVRAALLGLGEREREAVLLIAWEGLTPMQAARAAGCTSATFRGRLFRARRHLARTLIANDAANDQLSLSKEASGT
jgi:RNA polymerase sigma-70 factor (ECF subfamily)